MGAIALSCLLSGGIGLIVGGYTSVTGWIVASNLVFLVTVVAAFATGAPPLPALGWAVLVLVCFNAGLATSVGIAAGIRSVAVRNLHKALFNR